MKYEKDIVSDGKVSSQNGIRIFNIFKYLTIPYFSN